MSSPAGVRLRTVDDAELEEWSGVFARSFHQTRRLDAEELDLRRRRFAGQRLLGAEDAGRIVGTLRSWDVQLTVPGGCVLAEAVSSVAVAGTHRRRGVLTAMMGADLAAAHERGVACAVLLASEAPIYGRFGFAVAQEAVDWVVDGGAQVARTPAGTDDVVLQLVQDADLRPLAPAVHAAAVRGLPGAMPRTDVWWDVALGVLPVPGEDAERARPAVLARDGAGHLVGYARHHVDPARLHHRSAATLHVDDLVATTPAAHAALWRHLLGTDLVATVRAEARTPSEVLPWLLADRRAARQAERGDFLWVRVLDVAAVLGARRYALPGTAVLEVVDPGGPAAGRWRLDVDGDGTAAVSATAEPADAVLDVTALGATCLGQVPLRAVHGAGLVEEVVPGAVARLGALLAWEPASSITWTSF